LVQIPQGLRSLGVFSKLHARYCWSLDKRQAICDSCAVSPGSFLGRRDRLRKTLSESANKRGGLARLARQRVRQQRLQLAALGVMTV
jgi:hypothetical protein